MYQVRRHNKCLKFMIEITLDRDNFIMLCRDKLYRRVQCSLRVAIDARVNKRSGLAVSCRTAVALSQLQVQSCIAMLHFFAIEILMCMLLASITRTVIICNSNVFDTNSLHFNLFNTRLKCFIIHCLDILLLAVYVPSKAT